MIDSSPSAKTTWQSHQDQSYEIAMFLRHSLWSPRRNLLILLIQSESRVCVREREMLKNHWFFKTWELYWVYRILAPHKTFAEPLWNIWNLVSISVQSSFLYEHWKSYLSLSSFSLSTLALKWSLPDTVQVRLQLIWGWNIMFNVVKAGTAVNQSALMSDMNMSDSYSVCCPQLLYTVGIPAAIRSTAWPVDSWKLKNK